MQVIDIAAYQHQRELPYEIVSALIDYDPEAGRFWWRSRPREMFATQNAFATWNTRYAGTEAFAYLDGRGYRSGSIFHKTHPAHRVAWLLVHRVWPSADVDHINGDRADCRIVNLRDVSRGENLKNQRLSPRNTSGVCGVLFHKETQKWRAEIKVNGRNRHLGLFKTIDEAAAARKAANVTYGFSARHGEAA